MNTLDRDEIKLLKYGLWAAMQELPEWARREESDLLEADASSVHVTDTVREAAKRGVELLIASRIGKLEALRDKLDAILDSTLDVGDSVRVEPVPYDDRPA